MGFDDFFESNHKQHRNYQSDNYHDDHRQSYGSRSSYSGHGEHLNFLSILQKIKANRKLKFFIILTGIIIMVIVIALIIFLFPLITKLFNYIGQHGLQGVLDSIISFLDKIWKGSGN